MSIVYLHIGLHKTGTTAIQRFMRANDDLLKSKEGVAYFQPSPWPLVFNGQQRMMNLRLGGFKFLSEIDFPKVVISHENYSWLFDKKSIENLSSEILKYSSGLKVVLYLRRQDSLAVSQKQEGTKWIDNSVAYGHSEGALPDKLSHHASKYLDFYTKIKLWESVIGKENLIIRIFDKNVLLGGDVVQDFLYQIGMAGDMASYRSVGIANKSISRKRQIFLHRTRDEFKDRTLEKDFLVKSLLNMDLDDPEKLMPSKSEAENFYACYKESNSKLRRDYIDGNEIDPFSSDFSMYPDKSNFSELSLDEYIEYFHTMISSLLAEVEELKRTVDSKKESARFRDYALKIEKIDTALALELMERALALNPQGPFIKGKVKEYREHLSEKHSDRID